MVQGGGMWVVQVGGLGYVEKLISPPSPLYTPPNYVVTNSVRNIPYALPDYTTFRLGVTSSNFLSDRLILDPPRVHPEILLVGWYRRSYA